MSCVLPVALACACGGRASSNDDAATQAPGDPDDAAGAAGVAVDGSPGMPDPFPNAGGTGAAQVGAEPNGGAADAGTAGEALPLIRSGTRACLDYRDCLGLECIGATLLPVQICASSCPDGNECATDELCANHEGLAPTCLRRCQRVTDCSYQFDCFDLHQDGVFACVPSAWARIWDRPR